MKTKYMQNVSYLAIILGIFISSQAFSQLPDTSFKQLMYVPDTIIVKKDTSETVDQHVQDGPKDIGFKLYSDGGESNLRLYGSIRANGIYDLNGLQDKENFQTFDIPVGDKNVIEPRFYLSARQTRFGMEASQNRPNGSLSMKIEGDFFAENNALRLRHAYGTYGRFLIGQTWSAFGDNRSIPWTVDFEGPNSSVVERTVQVRYRTLLREKYNVTISMEAPTAEIDAPDSVNVAYQSIPDVVASILFEINEGHVKLTGVFRNINVKNTEGHKNNLYGQGFLISGKRRLSTKTEFLSQLVFGRGIARYITSLSGRNLDVLYNEQADRFETLTVYGGYFSIGHQWKEGVYSYFTPGFTGVVNKSYQPDDAFRFSGYFSGNVFWDVTEGVRVGAEYTWGSRINKGGESGMANRISFIVYYNF